MIPPSIFLKTFDEGHVFTQRELESMLDYSDDIVDSYSDINEIDVYIVLINARCFKITETYTKLKNFFTQPIEVEKVRVPCVIPEQIIPQHIGYTEEWEEIEKDATNAD